jgi:hypothetical protein
MEQPQNTEMRAGQEARIRRTKRPRLPVKIEEKLTEHKGAMMR